MGGLLFLLVPLLGWLLNLGHRWQVMERLYVDDPPWFRGFRPLDGTLIRGLGVAAMGIAYLGPGVVVILASLMAATDAWSVAGTGLGIAMMLLAFHAFPYAMARFAQSRDLRWLVGHRVAYRRACSFGRPYVRMWAFTWSAIALSVAPALAAILLTKVLDCSSWFLLVALPSAFLSPWAWSSLGYGFGTIIEPRIRLLDRDLLATNEAA